MSEGLAAEIKNPEMNQAMLQAKSMLERRERLNVLTAPYGKRLEYLDKELQRAHSTLQTKVSNHAQYTSAEDRAVETLQEHFFKALDEFAEAVRGAVEDYKNHT